MAIIAMPFTHGPVFMDLHLLANRMGGYVFTSEKKNRFFPKSWLQEIIRRERKWCSKSWGGSGLKEIGQNQRMGQKIVRRL